MASRQVSRSGRDANVSSDYPISNFRVDSVARCSFKDIEIDIVTEFTFCNVVKAIVKGISRRKPISQVQEEVMQHSIDHFSLVQEKAAMRLSKDRHSKDVLNSSHHGKSKDIVDDSSSNPLLRSLLTSNAPGAVPEESALENSESSELLSFLDLLCIGVGGTIGSGVFVLTGSVLPIAGPSAILSWLISGVVCFLSAFSYMELTARIPTRGSCYIFCYTTLGELCAVLGACCLTLEYGISGAGIARSWSDKFSALIGVKVTFQYGDGDLNVDLVAGVMQVLCIAICLCKLSLGTRVINTLTLLKVMLVIFLICIGIFPAWISPNSDTPEVFNSYDSFFPAGFGGCLTGASLLFFGFIGFDEVCCMAARSEDPRRVMPRAIAGTLMGAASLSCLAQLSLSYLVPYVKKTDDDNWTDPSFEQEFEDRGWSAARYITSVGEVALLPLVVLVSFLPQPELMAAMAEDNLIPSIFAQQRDGVFLAGGIITGVVMTIITILIPFSILWNVISLGVIFSFNLTNTSLIMLRCGNGGTNRKSGRVGTYVKLFWLFSSVGAYLTWLYGISPALNSGSVTWSLFAPGLVLTLMGLGLLRAIDVGRNDFADDGRDKETTFFETPMMPYTPGIAIVLNFFLMAQFAFFDHAVFLGLAMFCVAGYFLYKTKLHRDEWNEIVHKNQVVARQGY